MLKFVKVALLAVAMGLIGCGTVSQEKTIELSKLTRSTGSFERITEGRIIETRIGKRKADVTATDTIGAMTKSDKLAGLTLALGVIDLIEKSKDVFFIKYAERGTNEEKMLIAHVPRRPDLYKPGTLFRHVETKDGYLYLTPFETEEAFMVFNQ
jgi:hypothetical protein